MKNPKIQTNIQHLAVIMDGNRRWEQENVRKQYDGYIHGAQVLKELIENVVDIEIPYLTVYAFSSENWQRPIKDVAALMNIGIDWLNSNKNFLMEKGVRCRIIGNRELLPADVLMAIEEIERCTANNKNLNFQIALSYGARDEILRACIKFSKFIKDSISSSEITFEKFLDTKDIPDPDLLIRTGGQKRLSNYMLWQMAYTELCFLDVLWPNFTNEHLINAISEYSQTERRFGCV
jgi:undecaprenyl diphosphate synthase